MADAPPRDPKIAEGETPAAADAPSDRREKLNSNLQYLMKQPSTPWITYDREPKPAGDPDAIDAGWGETSEEPPPAPPQPAPPAPPSAPRVDPTPPPPAIDVPPPPAHMMAVIDQVLSQSRPPPADPGPANAPRESHAPIAATPAPEAVRIEAAPPSAPIVHPPRERIAPDPIASPPVADLAPPPDRSQPILASPIAPDDSLELARQPKKSNAMLFVALGGVALVLLAGIGVGLFVTRAPAPRPAASITTAEATNPPSASPSNAPPTAVTIASVAPSSPAPSASVAIANDPPIASAAPSAAALSSSAPVASSAPDPAGSIDPKTGLKRASYLTIPRAVARHYVFLDGKLMLGNGPRSFPVKCGEHTLAIDDRNATRVINVTCGGEYIVTN